MQSIISNYKSVALYCRHIYLTKFLSTQLHEVYRSCTSYFHLWLELPQFFSFPCSFRGGPYVVCDKVSFGALVLHVMSYSLGALYCLWWAIRLEPLYCVWWVSRWNPNIACDELFPWSPILLVIRYSFEPLYCVWWAIYLEPLYCIWWVIPWNPNIAWWAISWSPYHKLFKWVISWSPYVACDEVSLRTLILRVISYPM